MKGCFFLVAFETNSLVLAFDNFDVDFLDSSYLSLLSFLDMDVLFLP